MSSQNILSLVWHSVENKDTSLIQQLDIPDIALLLSQLQAQIKQEKSEIQLALLLNFKKLVLDVVTSNYPLSKLSSIVDYLHPMECVYMILNSIMSEDLQEFLIHKQQIYTIFGYICRWKQYKVTDFGDELYYETNGFTKAGTKEIVPYLDYDQLELFYSITKKEFWNYLSKQNIELLLKDDTVLSKKFYDYLKTDSSCLGEHRALYESKRK
ncbi:hypothetical protein HDV01_007189 [Terramyces sp. JEL0728]|nr:hypothetical protein HDV01_007189 [Terramyces sp. JEL0728]